MNTLKQLASQHPKTLSIIAFAWVVTLVGSYVLGSGLFTSSTPVGPNGGFEGARENFASQSRMAPGASVGRLGGSINGVILSVTPDTLVVKSSDGSSRIVMLSASTSVSRMQSIPASSLASGDDVVVMGANGTGGAINARSIQVVEVARPAR